MATEELVRGVDLIGTALTAFNKILAADNQSAAFNGTCGALNWTSSPSPPVGPGLLFSEIEVQKKPKSQERSPIPRTAVRRQMRKSGAMQR